MTRLSQSGHPYKRGGQRKHKIYVCTTIISGSETAISGDIFADEFHRLKSQAPKVIIKTDGEENDACLIGDISLSSSESLTDDINLAFVSERKALFSAWAAMRDITGVQWLDGVNTSKSAVDYTHLIYIPYRSNIDITRNMYICEIRLKSPNRWFQIISVRNLFEADRELEIRAKLMTSSLESVEPTNIEASNARGQYL